MTLKETFSTNIRSFRKERNLTQERFAELCEVSTNYIGDIERKKNFPSIELIERMSEVLAIEPYRFFLSNDSEEKAKIENRLGELKRIEKEELEAELIKAVKFVVEKF